MPPFHRELAENVINNSPQLKKITNFNKDTPNEVKIFDLSKKYEMKRTFTFDLKEKIYNPRVLKLITKVKFNHAKRVDELIEKQLIKDCRLIHKNMNKSNNTLISSFSKTDYSLGRYYYKNSKGLQGIYGNLRRLLCDGECFELDLVNSHIKLIKNILIDFNINAPTILNYDTDRDNQLQLIQTEYECNRDVAKNLFLILSYGGNFKTWLNANVLNKKYKPNEYIKSFQNEIKLIISSLVKSENNNYYLKCYNVMSKVKGKEKNEKLYYSALAIMLQDIETNIIYEVYKFLQSEKIDVMCNIHDGLLIDNKFNEKINENFIKIIIDKIKTITGFTIDFKKKSMMPNPDDNKWLENIEKLVDDKDNYYTIENDKEGSDYILNEHLKDSVYQLTNGAEKFIKKDNIWLKCDDKVIKYLIKRIISNIDIRFCDEEGNVKQYSYNNKGSDNLTSMVFANLPFHKDFNNLVFDTTKNKICFNDGVYDFITKEFTDWEIVENVYSMKKVDRDFPIKDCNTDKNIELINNRIWKNMFDNDEDIKFIKNSFARAIAGIGFKDKRFLVMMGERDCGKSKLISLFTNAFNSYIGTTSANNLLQKNLNVDSAKEMMWVADIFDTRILFTSEFKTCEGKVDGSKIKTICSGGDVVSMRTNHKDEIKKIPQFYLCMCLNDLPDCSDKDTKDKMTFCNLPYQFISKNSYDEKVKNEIDVQNFKIGDDNIDDFINDEEIINAFIIDILNHYVNEKPLFSNNIAKNTIEHNEGEKEIDYVYEEFEITGKYEDIVVMKEFVIKMKKLGSTLSSTKWINELKKVNNNVQKRKCEERGINCKKVLLHGVKEIDCNTYSFSSTEKEGSEVIDTNDES